MIKKGCLFVLSLLFGELQWLRDYSSDFVFCFLESKKWERNERRREVK